MVRGGCVVGVIIEVVAAVIIVVDVKSVDVGIMVDVVSATVEPVQKYKPI